MDKSGQTAHSIDRCTTLRLTSSTPTSTSPASCSSEGATEESPAVKLVLRHYHSRFPSMDGMMLPSPATSPADIVSRRKAAARLACSPAWVDGARGRIAGAAFNYTQAHQEDMLRLTEQMMAGAPSVKDGAQRAASGARGRAGPAGETRFRRQRRGSEGNIPANWGYEEFRNGKYEDCRMDAVIGVSANECAVELLAEDATKGDHDSDRYGERVIHEVNSVTLAPRASSPSGGSPVRRAAVMRKPPTVRGLSFRRLFRRSKQPCA